jgi:hypothetical protein
MRTIKVMETNSKRATTDNVFEEVPIAGGKKASKGTSEYIKHKYMRRKLWMSRLLPIAFGALIVFFALLLIYHPWEIGTQIVRHTNWEGIVIEEYEKENIDSILIGIIILSGFAVFGLWWSLDRHEVVVEEVMNMETRDGWL